MREAIKHNFYGMVHCNQFSNATKIKQSQSLESIKTAIEGRLESILDSTHLGFDERSKDVLNDIKKRKESGASHFEISKIYAKNHSKISEMADYFVACSILSAIDAVDLLGNKDITGAIDKLCISIEYRTCAMQYQSDDFAEFYAERNTNKTRSRRALDAKREKLKPLMSHIKQLLESESPDGGWKKEADAVQAIEDKAWQLVEDRRDDIKLAKSNFKNLLRKWFSENGELREFYINNSSMKSKG